MSMKDFFSQIKTRRVFWIYFACAFISILTVAFAFSYSEFDEELDFIFFLLNTLIVLWFWWKMKKLRFNREKDIKKYIQWKEILFLLFFNILFSLGISIFFSYLVANFFPGVIEWLLEESPILLKKQWDVLVVSFLGTVLLGPVAEEFVFRGVMFNRFTKRWGPKVGIFISSLLFGLVHGDPFIAVGAFVFGITLCVVYAKSHIIVPIIIHILNNLFVFLIGIVDMYFNAESGSITPEQMIAETERYGLTVGLPLVLVSSFFLFRYTKTNWPKIEKTV